MKKPSTTNGSANAPLCPISGESGVVRRVTSGAELLSLYETYLGKPIDPQYFPIDSRQTITEYHSVKSGLIWYDPCILGDGDYYAHLDNTYDWYYNPASWDKKKALLEVQDLSPGWVIEVGSGSGWLLSQIKLLNIPAFGIELSEDVVRSCRERGLQVYGVKEEFALPQGVGVLCLLQTIEHLDSPMQILAQYVERFRPERIILSAPCHESLLGHTADPLAWPPHHFTSWSDRSFHQLASKLGCVVEQIDYSPLTYEDLEFRLAKEESRKFFGLRFFPKGRLGRLVYRLRRITGSKWCLRGHSIFGILRVSK